PDREHHHPAAGPDSRLRRDDRRDQRRTGLRAGVPVDPGRSVERHERADLRHPAHRVPVRSRRPGQRDGAEHAAGARRAGGRRVRDPPAGGETMRTLGRAGAVAGLVVAAVFPLFPLYWMTISSLKSPAELSAIPPSWWPRELTFEAYSTVFDAVPFGRAFANSTLIAGLGTLSVLVTSVPAGYVFAKYRFPGRDALFWALVGTMFLPPI